MNIQNEDSDNGENKHKGKNKGGTSKAKNLKPGGDTTTEETGRDDLLAPFLEGCKVLGLCRPCI